MDAPHNCSECSLQGCPYVPSYGPDTVRMAIVGEAPGDTEVREGRPFVGRAGKLLDEILEEVGIERDACFITNACLCRPVPHRAPKAKEIIACRPRLVQELTDHAPDLILVLGAAALKAVLHKSSISAERGGLVWSNEFNAWVVPTYHPAAVLRNPSLYIDLLRDVKRAAQVLVRPPALPTSDNYLQHVLIEFRWELDALARRLSEVPELALDVETGSNGQMLSLALSWKPGTAVVITETALKNPYTISTLNRVLSTKHLIGHNLKYDLKVLWAHGITSAKTGEDSMLAHYSLDERRGIHGLKALAKEYLNAPDYDAEIKRYKKQMETCPRDLLYKYNAYDASYTMQLMQILRDELGPNEKRVLTELLYPASDVLAQMEYLGIMVDVAHLAKLDEQLAVEIHDLVHRLHEAAGREFNPNSSKQVQQLLYEELELPIPGRISADEAALKEIAEYHPLPNLLLEYRNQKKFHSTYVQSLLEQADLNGRVHATFNLHGTATGRLSSSNPNLQNIPREGRARNIFVATPGYTLVEGDLSQAEVRVLAWFCKDKTLLDNLAQGGDIHTRTACIMFNRKPEEVTKEMRQAAKRITFGLIYQMSPQGLAEALRGDGYQITLTEAEELMQKFFEAFPKAKEWITSVQEEVRRTGKVSTPFGRVRRFDYITRENYKEIMRQCVNAPIQSTASDLTLAALIRLGRRTDLGDTRLLLTVHDSILLETRENSEEIAREVYKEMTKPILLGVPIEADIKIGQRWGDLKEVAVA